jgi:aminoglycoside phosphotransferase family enzyme
MTADTLPDFIHFLRQPVAYQHPAPDISLVQTHISYVLLAGDFVYKIKKPVNFGFLDFSTLAKRKFYCEEELRLNRRLCPRIYLEVVSVNEEKGIFSLNGPGRAVEYAVKMVRMPEEGMMGRLIKENRLTERHLDLIVDTLVPFYRQAEINDHIRQFGKARAVAANVLENFEQARPYVGGGILSREEFEHITGYARSVLAKEALFDQRIAANRICDCHGDLYSANICFEEDQVHIFDCIEFNERFRYCDIASDVAFLAMDLDAKDQDSLSVYFIERFIARSGDAGLSRMLNFYKCYRATVRGKIGLLTAHEPEVDDQTRAAAQTMAARYFLLAQQYADQCQASKG